MEQSKMEKDIDIRNCFEVKGEYINDFLHTCNSLEEAINWIKQNNNCHSTCIQEYIDDEVCREYDINGKLFERF